MGRLVIFALMVLLFVLLAGEPNDGYGPLPDPCYPYACHMID